MSKHENTRLCGPGKPGNSSNPLKKGLKLKSYVERGITYKVSVVLVSRGKQSGKFARLPSLFVLGEKELDIDRKRERREREGRKKVTLFSYVYEYEYSIL